MGTRSGYQRKSNPRPGEIGVVQVARVLGRRPETIMKARIYERLLQPRIEVMPSGRLRRWYSADRVGAFAAIRALAAATEINIERDSEANE